jgi:hypothetical protein
MIPVDFKPLKALNKSFGEKNGVMSKVITGFKAKTDAAFVCY